MVEINWIQQEEKWGVFLNNWVKESWSLSKRECWMPIPGKLNLADLASCGCTPQYMLQCSSWKGPEFPKNCPEVWLNYKFLQTKTLLLKKEKECYHLHCWDTNLSGWMFSKIVKIFCWILQFVSKLRKRSAYSTDTLTVEDKTVQNPSCWV